MNGKPFDPSGLPEAERKYVNDLADALDANGYGLKDYECDDSHFIVEDGHVVLLGIGAPYTEDAPPLKALVHLRELWFWNTKDGRIPSGICGLKRLETLGCVMEGVKWLPEEIGRLSSLKTLNVEGNPIESLPSDFGGLESLEELNLKKCRLKELPESFGNLKNLKTLDLSQNRLESLPESFGELKSLETLDLRKNHSLRGLPDSFGKLVTLKEARLALCGGGLAFRRDFRFHMPASVGKLKNLEHLSLLDVPFGKFPPDFDRLTSLKRLDISGCRLESIDAVSGLESLEVLYADTNSVKRIPQDLGKLVNLKIFSVNDNEISELPESLGSLPNLRILRVRNNRISQIPASLAEIETLEKIWADKNDIKDYPDSLKMRAPDLEVVL